MSAIRCQLCQSALLLTLFLLTAAAPPLYPLDTVAVRQVLEATMRCQSLRQLHAAAVHRNLELFSIRLELQPDGQVKDIVDQKLLFLASVSKGMFGTALVRVEQHLRTLLNNHSFSLFETPIKQLIGDENFWFLDHGRSQLVTIDDLVSHRTGLARHDSLWYLGQWQSKQELAKYVSRLKATADFRNSFVYNNLVWTLADIVVQKLTNKTFVEYMREFLWLPLEMGDTKGVSELTQNELLNRVDISRFHRPLGMALEMTKMAEATRFVEAAGGILTSLPDMMKYMSLQASHNYSAYEPVPGQFRPLNALAAGSDKNVFFNKRIYNDGITDLPDWEIESYTRGWGRTWYRDHLDYSHGGSLLGVRCELDVFAKQNVAVFNHMTLGSAAAAPYQALYANVINKYISDLLLFNQSFVTKDNVCALFRNVSSPSGTARLSRRQLTDAEITSLQGSYGNYGFGKAHVTFNRTSWTFSLAYGIGLVEMIPVDLRPSQKQSFDFFMNLLEPLESASSGVVLNRTQEAIYVVEGAQLAPGSFLTISLEAASSGKLTLRAVALEQDLALVKDLDPAAWTRPKLCLETKSAAAGSLRLSAAAGVVAATVALLVGRL